MKNEPLRWTRIAPSPLVFLLPLAALSVALDTSATEPVGPYPEERHRGPDRLIVQHRYEEAIANLREAVRLDPDHAEAHVVLASLLQRQGREDDAIRHFRERVRIKPGDASAHNELGIALADRGRLDQAIEHFSAAVRLDPGLAAARANLEMALRLRAERSEGSGGPPLPR